MQDPRHTVRELRGYTERQIVSLVLQVAAELTRDTPVDTGWASSNWIPNIGSPVSRPSGTRENVSLAGQDSGSARVAAQYRLPNQVHITNNVPYIGDLNAGTSPQAETGYVENALQRAIDIVEARRAST